MLEGQKKEFSQKDIIFLPQFFERKAKETFQKAAAS